jgi:hypothetical protein
MSKSTAVDPDLTALRNLVRGLRRLGHDAQIEQETGRGIVRPSVAQKGFVLLWSGDWLQIASVLTDKLAGVPSPNRERLAAFVLQVHGRYLGCRLGLDDDGDLSIVNDVYPGHATPKHIATVIEQLDYVAEVLSPLIHSIILGGNVPSDAQIDEAFSGIADN